MQEQMQQLSRMIDPLTSHDPWQRAAEWSNNSWGSGKWSGKWKKWSHNKAALDKWEREEDEHSSHSHSKDETSWNHTRSTFNFKAWTSDHVKFSGKEEWREWFWTIKKFIRVREPDTKFIH